METGDSPGPRRPSPSRCGKVTVALSAEGSGGRRRASSPKLRGNASAPSRCPASSVTTATLPGCPLTPFHTRERWRTRCLVLTRSSPNWTCSRGRNRTRVRKTPPLRRSAGVSSSTSVCDPSLSDPRCGPIPGIQSGHWLLCDSVVLYQCQRGFKLSGSSSASCDPVSQQWSSRPPTCRGTVTRSSSKAQTSNIPLIQDLLLQTSTSAKNKLWRAQKTLSASTSRVHSPAQVCSDPLNPSLGKLCFTCFYHVLFLPDPEPLPLATASAVGAVMVLFGGAATLLLLVFCYRRYDHLRQHVRSFNENTR